MEPCLFNIDTARELRLRRHIREVLLPYARTHLTLGHVAFTETVVEDVGVARFLYFSAQAPTEIVQLLLQTLHCVPMADATSFLLPTEPFEVLMRPLGTLDLTPPEERWAIPSQYITYLRTFFPPPPRPADLRTEKCWHEDDHYLKITLIHRPISPPILSKRARRETPKLGCTNTGASIPRTRSALTTLLDLNPVSVQDIELPTASLDDVLDLRFKFDSTARERVRPLLQLVLGPSTRAVSLGHFEDTPHVAEFLSPDSPPRCLLSLASPPLFPRITRVCSTQKGIRNNAESGTSNLVRVSDLTSVLQAASPELISGEDGDINDQHMEVVNGWTILAFSSPPPPSLRSSGESEVDELWDISPLGSPATSLMVAKMDEVEIPRIRKFGHKNTLADESMNGRGRADLLTVANSPGFFITSFISAPIAMTKVPNTFTSQPEDVKSSMQSPHPLSPGQNTSNSLLGQPPSAPEEQTNEETLTRPASYVEDFEEQRFDDAIASIYASAPQDPFTCIKEEKLDDKEIMLMDVPNLPPPTAHPKEPNLFPEGMQTFIVPKGEVGCLDITGHGSKGHGSMAFLKPVAGIKPLALDLSWKPFNFGKAIPTDEEVAGIAKPIQPEDEGPGYRDDQFEKTACVLLDLGSYPISAENDQPKVPRVCEEFGMSPTPKRVEESGHVEYLLTQRERTRASGTKITPEADVEVQHNIDPEQNAPLSYDDEPGDVMTRIDGFLQHYEREDSRNLDPMDDDHSHTRANNYSFDDPGSFSTIEFGAPSHLLQLFQDGLLYAADHSEANKENLDDQSEDEENVPPRGADNAQLAEYQPDPLVTQYDWSDYLEFPESETPSFEPLSFASQSQLARTSDHFTNSKVQNKFPLTPSTGHVERPEGSLIPVNECEETHSRAVKRRKLDDLVPPSSKDLFSTFIGLRNQVISSCNLELFETRNDMAMPHQTPDVPEQIHPRVTPDDVFDPHTVRLPEHWIPAAVVHRYLASVIFIQKRALVRELQGPLCRIVLIERYDLGETDIIIDPDYGVLFIPLFTLPAHIQPAIDRISRESWRYIDLLIIFEAFPGGESYKADHAWDNRPVPYAYTPPICKAIRKLRRNLGIADGCGTMNPRCTVRWAFANDVEEAAKFVRCFGEEACAIQTERGHGILWDERAWLEEEREGELELAKAHGMNAFAAFVMLHDRSLETILNLPPEIRLADFGHLLGQERVVRRLLSLVPIDPSTMMQMGLNALIERGMQQIIPDFTDSVVGHGC